MEGRFFTLSHGHFNVLLKNAVYLNYLISQVTTCTLRVIFDVSYWLWLLVTYLVMSINPYFKKSLMISVYFTDFLAELTGSSLLLHHHVSDKAAQ